VSGPRLFWHQLRFEWKLFWRNPASVFFSVGLPLVFLFLVGAVFGGDEEPDPVYGLVANQYLVPAIMTLGIVGATFNNVAMTITIQRERGMLKRLRGTPLPTGVFISARAASAVLNALVIVLVILLAGLIFYGVELDARRLLGTLIVSVVGAATFCALGFAITIVIPNDSAATPITNMITLPLYFISGVFGEVDKLPALLADIGQIFPISRLGACLLQTYSPHSSGVIAFQAKDFAVLVAWGIAGLLLAAWKFRWEPQENR
jgi:ABC-2 type transport system permease protein